MTEAGPAARGPARVTRARMLFGLRVLASVTLLWLVLSSVGSQEALSRLTAAEPFWILAALLFLALQTLLSAWRWRITAAALGQTLTGRRAVREYWLAQLLNQACRAASLAMRGARCARRPASAFCAPAKRWWLSGCRASSRCSACF